jgi:putative flippase GtrA
MRQSDLARIQRFAATGLGWVNSPTNQIISQFLRYAIVVGVAYSVDIVLLVLLIEKAGLHYLISVAIGYIAGLIVKYALSILWVFKTRRLSNKYVEFSVFVMIGFVGLGFNELLIWVLSGLMHVHYLASKVVATGLTVFWNFGARRYVLFR